MILKSNCNIAIVEYKACNMNELNNISSMLHSCIIALYLWSDLKMVNFAMKGGRVNLRESG